MMGGGCCVGDCCVMNCGFCCIGDFFSCKDGCSYHPQENKTEAHAKKIANELADLKEKGTETAEIIENEVIENINTQMNQFINDLKNINQKNYGGKKLNINIGLIEQNNAKLKNKVVGFIGRKLEDRLVLTDKELSLILKEPDDTKRAKNFDAFYNKVKKDAISKLIEEIEETIAEQSSMINSEIKNRLNEVQDTMDEALTAYNEVCELKEREDSGLEKKRVEYMYQCTLCEILLNQIAL